MKLFFSSIILLVFSISPLLAQNFLDKNFEVSNQYEEGKSLYLLKPKNDTIFSIFDLEDNFVGIEENEIKQAGDMLYKLRMISILDENEKVIEKHKLVNLKNNIRYSTFLNHHQQVIRQEQWKDGILSYRSYTDPITNETTIDQIILPGPAGGHKEWHMHVAQTLRYPMEAIVNKQTGIVHITFEIDSTGNLQSVEVSNSDEIHSSLSTEAIRIISQYKGGWQPHQINGEAISSTLTYPIVFQMSF